MAGRSIRNLFKQGGSHLITLPHEWIQKNRGIEQVHVVYDDVVLIFSEQQRERVEAIFEKLIQKTVEHLADTEEAEP